MRRVRTEALRVSMLLGEIKQVDRSDGNVENMQPEGDNLTEIVREADPPTGFVSKYRDILVGVLTWLIDCCRKIIGGDGSLRLRCRDMLLRPNVLDRGGCHTKSRLSPVCLRVHERVSWPLAREDRQQLLARLTSGFGAQNTRDPC